MCASDGAYFDCRQSFSGRPIYQSPSTTIRSFMPASTVKAFDFVKIDMPPKKPRRSGIIEIRGPYYSSISYGYLRDLLSDWGEYVDGYKFAGGSMRLLSRQKLRQIIHLCHANKVYVSTGGFVERVIVQGSDAVDEYLRECKRVGFDVVEVSSGLAPIPLKDKIQYRKAGAKTRHETETRSLAHDRRRRRNSRRRLHGERPK